jgi:propanol-preferring alcohol dehydrogenase
MTKLPETHKAYVFTSGSTNLTLKDIPMHKPGPGEVILKLKASGVCHSDLHILQGSFPIRSGSILGHEIAGTVVAHGAGVNPEAYPPGQLYAAVGPNPCGVCRDCRNGKDNLCQSDTRTHYGLGYPGGYEQYTLANVRNLVKVPEGVSPEVAAVTTDAVLTPYHAFKKAQINGLSRILIIGLGGLGINAVQIAKAMGAHVTAFDLKESSRELARKFGADVVLDSLTVEDESKEYDFVADIVSVQSTFDLAFKQIKSNGLIIPLGLGSAKLTFDQNDLLVREIRILGSFWGTSLDQVEVFDLVKRGVITPQVETGKFKDLNEILQKLEKGQIKSRLVLTDFDDI